MSSPPPTFTPGAALAAGQTFVVRAGGTNAWLTATSATANTATSSLTLGLDKAAAVRFKIASLGPFNSLVISEHVTGGSGSAGPARSLVVTQSSASLTTGGLGFVVMAAVPQTYDTIAQLSAPVDMVGTQAYLTATFASAGGAPSTVSGTASAYTFFWELQQVAPPITRYALIIKGQSNSVGANGQGVGGPATNYEYGGGLPLPESGNPGIRDGPGESEERDPRIKMIYNGNQILQSGVAFSGTDIKTMTSSHYEATAVPLAVGDAMTAACPVQAGTMALLSNEAVSWPFVAAKRLLAALPNDTDEIWIIGNGVGGSGFTPVEYGGTGQQTWDKSLTTATHNFYLESEARTKAAVDRYGLKPVALLYHQGEHDAGLWMPGPVYGQKLDALIANFRSFAQTNGWVEQSFLLPVVVGLMATASRTTLGTGPAIHQVHLDSDTRGYNVGVADTRALASFNDDIGDGVHLTADGHRDAGLKVAEALSNLISELPIDPIV